jgi:dynein heavy chain
MGGMEILKILLNTITEIKDSSMEMEFRILEVQESYRLLKNYEYKIDEETEKKAASLMINWEELLDFADKKDFEANSIKKSFAEVTKNDVETFKKKIKDEYETYLQNGPGTSSVSLERGMELLQASKLKIKQFNQDREENVLAEKLFNLEISKYPELIAMEEANKKYDEVYSVFDDYQKKIKDFSSMSWSKLDAS